MTNLFNKKNGQAGQLAVIIIILVSAIVIFLFITKFTSKATFEQSINTCRLSVIAQSATEVFPSVSGKKSPFDINCDKRYVQLNNNKAELGLSLTNMKSLPINLEGKKITKYNSLNEYIVNQVVAEELRVCKFEFGDGLIDVFGNDNSDWIGGKTICFVCSEITFDNSDNKPPKIFKNLVTYTKNTNFDNSNITYYNYLRSTSREGNIMWGQPDYDPSLLTQLLGANVVSQGHMLDKFEDNAYANLDLNSSKRYLVFYEVYVSSKSDFTIQKKPQWVAIVPSDEIKNYCNYQAS